LTATAEAPRRSSFAALSFLDRYLTVWIILAMLIGVGLGAVGVRLPSVLVPIGLIVMMYPPFARVRGNGRSRAAAFVGHLDPSQISINRTEALGCGMSRGHQERLTAPTRRSSERARATPEAARGVERLAHQVTQRALERLLVVEEQATKTIVLPHREAVNASGSDAEEGVNESSGCTRVGVDWRLDAE